MKRAPSLLGLRVGSASGLWPVVSLAVVAAVLSLAPIAEGTRVKGVLIAGVAAVAAGVLIERERMRRLRGLERQARGLAAVRLGRGEGGSEGGVLVGGEGGAGGVGGAGGADPFGALQDALDDLGGRISEQLKELAKRGRNLEALIDALDEPVLATDDEEQVLLCNRAAEELFDARPGGLAGRRIAALFTQEEVLAMHSAARRGETRRGRVKLTTTTMGSRVFQVSAAPVPVAWGEGVFGAVLLLRDVTELDRAVQVKSDFVANASHELRTPVSAIHGAVETLLEGGVDDPGMRGRLLMMVKTHAERLEEMIRDLLDLSRLESPDVEVRPETVDLREVEGMLRPMFEEVCGARRLELEFRIDPGAERIRTDRRLLGVVLRNLIENATKFAYEGTRVTVAARAVRGPGRNGSGAGDAAGGMVRLEVTDRGVGVPLHLRERVFERYFQVDPARTGVTARRGTGLGLSIVKHAVKALGGEVGLESVWKEGTTVWVELPVGSGGG